MTTDERLHWLNKIEALTMERDCYKAALERIAAHGCCVMHNDSGCPGCGAKDALAGKSRQDANYKPTTKNEGVTINSSDECNEARGWCYACPTCKRLMEPSKETKV